MAAEDEATYSDQETHGDFDHPGRTNWWCSFAPNDFGEYSSVYGHLWVITPLPELTTLSKSIPVPAFLTRAERRQLQFELEALARLGTAPNYLLRETVRWARARPSDLEAAEALARAIAATRWACGDEETARYARTAFRVLHTSFGKTSWARRTKYWYDGRG
jgi:hypothetical protein